METVRSTRARRVIDAGGRGKSPAGRADAWIAALKAANDEARERPDAKRRLYQANYRIQDEDSRSFGSYDERRQALRAILKSLAPMERHSGTSTWIFQLWIDDAADVAKLIGAPLDFAMDLLSVGELKKNRAVLGEPKLKS